MKQYKTQGHHLFRYSPRLKGYVHVYANPRYLCAALIKAYENEKAKRIERSEAA